MTTTARRRIALGAVPALLLTGALAGCNDSAPKVEAPPSTAAPSSTSSSVPTAPSTTEAPPTDPGVPTVSTAPTEPASATGDPAKRCTARDSSFLTPGALAPTTKKAAWGKPLDLSQKYGGVITITPSAPVAKKPSEDDIFGPKDGQQYLLIKVTVSYKSGDKSSINDIYFTLRDAQKNICEDESVLTDAVPKQELFDDATLDKTAKTYSGTLVYDVPAGQDYKKYTLLYRPSDYTNKSPDASVAWTG